MEKLTIIKIGGKIIDNENELNIALTNFSKLPQKKLLVHGGGNIANKLLGQMGIEPKMVDGRRITDEETLDVIVMVYAGLINKNIVSQLQSLGTNSIGLTGADGGSILSHKRITKTIERKVGKSARFHRPP